jgi:glycine/serine hydroxymethyltransferase
MKESEMETVAEMIDTVLSRIKEPSVGAEIAAGVEELCKRFPLYPETQES